MQWTLLSLYYFIKCVQIFYSSTKFCVNKRKAAAAATNTLHEFFRLFSRSICVGTCMCNIAFHLIFSAVSMTFFSFIILFNAFECLSYPWRSEFESESEFNFKIIRRFSHLIYPYQMENLTSNVFIYCFLFRIHNHLLPPKKPVHIQYRRCCFDILRGKRIEMSYFLSNCSWWWWLTTLNEKIYIVNYGERSKNERPKKNQIVTKGKMPATVKNL